MDKDLSHWPSEDGIPTSDEVVFPVQGSKTVAVVETEILDSKAVNQPIFAFKNPILSGTPAVEGEHGVVLRSRMYELGEAFFRQSGMACRDLGWAVYPQTRDTVRRPGVIPGIGAIKIGGLKDAPATQAEVQFWVDKLPTLNVACVAGPGSGGMVGIDIDVSDFDDAGWATKLAFETLGTTPFMRQGRPPRMMLLYRLAEGVSLPSSAHRFDVDGKPGEDAIEILGAGKSITFYGAHHSTGDYFRWGDLQPSFASVDKLPVITPEQIKAFLDRVDHYKPLHHYRPVVVTHLEADIVEFDGDLSIPPRRMDSGVWERRGEGKLLVDGRQSWIFNRAFSWVRFNSDACRTDEGSKVVLQAFLGEAYRYVERSGRWASEDAIRREVTEVYKRTRDNLLADRIKAATVTFNADGTRSAARRKAVLAIGGDLGDAKGWVPEPGSKDRRESPSKIVPKTDEDHRPNRERAEKLRLLGRGERIALQARVSAEVIAHIDSFLDRVWDEQERIAEAIKGGKSPLPEILKAVEALIAPTGAGKTSQFIRRFAAKVAERGRLPFAIAIYLPGHANTAEAKAVATSAGGVDVWDDAIAASRGLRMMIYRGKAAAGCLIADQLQRLLDAGVSTAGACRTFTKDKATNEQVEERCVHYDACPAIAQRKMAQEADLILLAHAYLEKTLPAEVSGRIGVTVIDESFWNGFVHYRTMPLDALRLQRADVYLTDTDKRDGMSVMDYRMQREQAAEIATRALLAGDCPARTLASYSRTSRLSNKTVSGLELVRSAKTVCSRSLRRQVVKPNMQPWEVEAIIGGPVFDHVALEARFWDTIEEAILAFRAGKKRGEAREDRIKMSRSATTSTTGEEVRHDAIGVSWRSRVLMSNRPAFLLDASADEMILRKIYGTRSVRVHRVEAPLHLRTIVVAESMSDQSLIPNASGNRKAEDRLRAAERLSKARHMISYIAALYPGERILIGCTKAVELALLTGWTPPPNCDFGHFKNFAGLDCYREHAVAISLGRIELPVDVIDGLARALSYDDDVGVEVDWDVHGTGYLDGKKLRAPEGERRIQRRDGAVMTLKASVYPEHMKWHRAVQGQWREEELRQFVGRLRPVYRDGEAPLYICCATCVPDGLVVDDVLTLNQIVKGAGTAELARRLGGVLDDRCGPEHHDVIGGQQMIADAIAGMPTRIGGCYATVRIWSDGEQGEGRTVKVAGWQHDLWTAIANSERAQGRELDRYEVIETTYTPNAKVMTPQPSKLDRQMSRLPHAATATREELLQERADAEVNLREKVMEAVQSRSPATTVDWSRIEWEGSKVSLEIAMILAAFPMPSENAVAVEPDPPPIAAAA